MRYDRDFREEAVRIVEETGKPIAQVDGQGIPRKAERSAGRCCIEPGPLRSGGTALADLIS